MIRQQAINSVRRCVQQTLDMREINVEKRKETQPKTKENKEDHMRIYHQNVNGIGNGGQEGVEEMMTHIKKLQVAVHSLVETNVEWTTNENRNFVESTKRALRTNSGKRAQYSMQATSCKGWNGNRYQPGGTSVGAVGQWATRVVEKGQDRSGMGRWSYLTIALKGIKISFISAYRVCQQVKDLDKNTAYMQQWRVLAEKYENPPDPRKQTLVDLKKFLKEEKEKGREVVLMLDANEGMENRTDEMIEIINEGELIDVHARSDPFNEVETYARGKQRIDYILVTERIADCVEYTNIAQYNEGIVSDRRALIMDINVKKLQEGDLTNWERKERNLNPGLKRHRQ